jgi:pseudouridine kinase
MSNKSLIIGAINIDIINEASTMNQEDSNLSSITMGFGGVAGNIAFNLKSLGIDIKMLTVLSKDHFQTLITSVYQKKDIPLYYDTFDVNSSIYLAIMNKGDMIYGFNDMKLIEYLTPSFLKKYHTLINTFDTLILDNNLSVDTLKYITKTYPDKKIYIDAVSITKAPKLKSILSNITLLKVNKQELDVLTTHQSLEQQLKELHQFGVKEIIVTNKSEAVIYSNNESIIKKTPKEATSIISTSGCGDAFFSGFISGVTNNKTISESLDIALNQAYRTLFVKQSTIEG